jgi:iron-sulfur cluster assembly protein
MFTLTASAAEQILLAAQNQTDGAALPMLRIAAKYGDDGEIVYGMGFDEQREHDIAIESAGVVILIAPPSQELLDGSTLDFAELHPGEFQFVFINPHEPSSCNSAGKAGGCGGCRCG